MGRGLAEPSDDRSGPTLKGQELAQARDRLEKLFAVATDHRSQQLILYKVFLTFVLEGLDYQAELLRQRFSYTGENTCSLLCPRRVGFPTRTLGQWKRLG